MANEIWRFRLILCHFHDLLVYQKEKSDSRGDGLSASTVCNAAVHLGELRDCCLLLERGSWILTLFLVDGCYQRMIAKNCAPYIPAVPVVCGQPRGHHAGSRPSDWLSITHVPCCRFLDVLEYSMWCHNPGCFPPLGMSEPARLHQKQ